MNNWHLFFSQPPTPLRILPWLYSKADITEMGITACGFIKILILNQNMGKSYVIIIFY